MRLHHSEKVDFMKEGAFDFLTSNVVQYCPDIQTTAFVTHENKEQKVSLLLTSIIQEAYLEKSLQSINGTLWL